MTTPKPAQNPAGTLLRSILDRGFECGADTIELERAPDGLEIMYIVGHTGVGDVLRDRKMECALINLIVDRAGLEQKERGTLTETAQGLPRKIPVEVYDSFGESCFRLKLPRVTRK